MAALRPQGPRYPMAQKVAYLCTLLQISPQRVLLRAGMPTDFLEHEGRGATVAQYFALLHAIVDEADRPDLGMFLGRQLARGLFVTAMFAFSCSPTVRIGVGRLSVFKPLVAPSRLTAVETDRGFEISFESAFPEFAFPPCFSEFELVYLTENSRSATAKQIRPVAASLSDPAPDMAALAAYLGCPVTVDGTTRLILSPEDADLPLLSLDSALWSVFEPRLREQLNAAAGERPVSARVHTALLSLLPSGRATIQDVCDHLNLSKRSLQRHLKAEARTFQTVLDETRQDLAAHYLGQDDVSLDEISYLLGYRDPNSFHRAFKQWNGATPTEARGRV